MLWNVRGWMCAFVFDLPVRNFDVGMLRMATVRVDLVSRGNDEARNGRRNWDFPAPHPLIQGGSDSATPDAFGAISFERNTDLPPQESCGYGLGVSLTDHLSIFL